jgi:NAD(P)-dependent dehydrogenase (short-subunit alcohol dehydrogenase family)
MLNIDLSNKNILVTGAAGTGIGSGICEAIEACGGNLIINDLEKDKVQIAVKKYQRAIGVSGDISNTVEIKRIFKEIKERLGVVHGLVNNAGIGLSKKAHLASIEEFDGLYNVDVRGLWLMSKTFTRQLLDCGETGNIVNMSSIHSMATLSKYAIYASAKSAVNGLTRGMSVELGKEGIRCNAVAPGYVHAEQNEKLIGSWSDNPKKWVEDLKSDYQSLSDEITARDCGNTVVFLLSDLSKSITGQTIVVDAGSINLAYANSFISENNKNSTK